MKTFINPIRTGLFALLLAAGTQVSAQQLKMPAPSPVQTIDQAFALSNINVEYSRPSAKGRTIFGGLVPFDQVWRTGANASTKVTFGEDVVIGGKPLTAGTYALYTKPGKDNWQVMFYKDLDLGGNVANYNASNEALSISVKPTALNDKVETFTIQFTDLTANAGNITLSWENTSVSIPVSVEIDATIMKNIEKALAADTRPYYLAARYYYENDKDLNKALDWANKAVAQNPKAFWVAHLKANIQYKLKDYKGAIATAEQSKTLASEAKNADYVKLNEQLIEQAKKGK